MARRVTQAEVSSVKKTINPYSQPCFSTYTMHYSHGGGYYLYDHNLNLISADHSTGDSSYGSFRSYTTSASQFFENMNSYPSIRTEDTPSSSSDRASGTNQIGYLGHMSHLRGCAYGNFGGWNASSQHNGTERRSRGFRDVCPIINETHQDYAIFGHHAGTSGTWFYVGQRSASNYWTMVENGPGTGGRGILIPTQSSGGQGMYGSICYNKKTKKLLVMESNGSFGHTPVVWNNVPDLRQIAHNRSREVYKDLGDSYTAHPSQQGYLHDYFQDSSNCTVYTQNNFNTNSYSGQGEANWRSIPVLNDDGSITVFHQMPSHGALVYRWNASGNPTGVDWNASWTTSYGYEQGSRFGAHWQVTSDGSYIMAGCCSYYYGAGAYFAAIRVSDGKFLRFQTNDSTYGRHWWPVGKSDMGWSYNANTDGGRGLYFRTVNLPMEFAVRGDGADMSLDSHWTDYTLECGHYSTSYPVIIPAQYDTALFSAPHLPED